MAFTLMKGPVVKKLMVLLLLTFSGLGYPPDVGEALKCHTCNGDIKGGDITCDQNAGAALQKDCFTEPTCLTNKLTGASGDGEIHRSCGFSLNLIHCMQEKAGQSGFCVKGKEKEMFNIQKDCIKKLEPGAGIQRASEDTDSQSTSEGRQSTTTKELCFCQGDLCNEKDWSTMTGSLPKDDKGKGKGSGGDKGSGSVLKPSEKMVAITGGLILVLATQRI